MDVQRELDSYRVKTSPCCISKTPLYTVKTQLKIKGLDWGLGIIDFYSHGLLTVGRINGLFSSENSSVISLPSQEVGPQVGGTN